MMLTAAKTIRAAITDLDDRYKQWTGCTLDGEHIHSKIIKSKDIILQNISLLEDMMDKDRKCIVCLVEPEVTTLLPCGHKYCGECPAKFVATTGPKCPFCRAKIMQIVPNTSRTAFTPVNLNIPFIDDDDDDLPDLIENDDDDLPDYHIVGQQTPRTVFTPVNLNIPFVGDDNDDLPDLSDVNDEDLPDYHIVGQYQPPYDDADDLPDIRGITRHADLLAKSVALRQAVANERREIRVAGRRRRVMQLRRMQVIRRPVVRTNIPI